MLNEVKIEQHNNEEMIDKIAHIIAKLFNTTIELVSKLIQAIINVRDFILSLLNKMEYASVI